MFTVYFTVNSIVSFFSLFFLFCFVFVGWGNPFRCFFSKKLLLCDFTDIFPWLNISLITWLIFQAIRECSMSSFIISVFLSLGHANALWLNLFKMFNLDMWSLALSTHPLSRVHFWKICVEWSMCSLQIDNSLVDKHVTVRCITPIFWKTKKYFIFHFLL